MNLTIGQLICHNLHIAQKLHVLVRLLSAQYIDHSILTNQSSYLRMQVGGYGLQIPDVIHLLTFGPSMVYPTSHTYQTRLLYVVAASPDTLPFGRVSGTPQSMTIIH